MVSRPANEAINETAFDLADVTVVGAGLAGMIAAVEASRRGLTVNIIEKKPQLGGRATSVNRDGFTLNQGPHAVYVGGALNQVLNQFSIGLSGVPPSDDGEGIVVGRRGRLPSGPVSVMRTKLLSTRAKPKLAAALTKLGRQKPSEVCDTSVERWINSLTTDIEVQGLIKGVATIATYNAALDLASADAAVSNLQLVLGDGVLYVHGGWQKIVDALQAQIDRSARIRRIAGTVTKVEATSDTWVSSIGERIERSRTVLVASGTPEMADRLFGLDIFAAAAGPNVTASVLDLGLVEPPLTPALFNFDRALYMSLHSVADGLSPAPSSLVTLARYRLPDDTATPAETEQMLADHAEAAGIRPGHILMRRYLHRMTVAHGMPLAAQGGLTGRPVTSVPRRAGAYIAGDWVGPSGLLADASAASALAAVDGVVSYVNGSLRLQSAESPLHA